MSLFQHTTTRATLALALLFAASTTTAQTCYFPNGSESNHTACRTSGSEAACCSTSDVCMDNGLCFGEGIMSRGSCTDKEWKSGECSQYCGDVSLNTSIPLMACTNEGNASKFICGMNSTSCRSTSATFTLSSSDLTFRPSELEAIVNPAVSSALAQAQSTSTEAAAAARVTVTALPTSTSDSSNAIYTPAAMAGLGLGLGIPLLITSIFALLLWKRDRERTPKLMYPLPDDLADPYTSIDGKPLHPGIVTAAAIGGGRPPVSRDGSIMSFNTLKSGGGTTPAHLQTFAQRYQVMKDSSGAFQIARVELDGSSPTMTAGRGEYEADQHEMHDLKVPLPKEF